MHVRHLTNVIRNLCHKNGKKGVFLVRKGLCTISTEVKIRKIREKRGKIRKTWSMTKKKVMRNFCRENGNFFRKKLFPKKRHLGPRKIFPSPQTRRQVSATGYAHDLLVHFVLHCRELYGEEFLVCNVHSMIHMTAEAQQFGCLDNCSGFIFENYLQQIKLMVRAGSPSH